MLSKNHGKPSKTIVEDVVSSLSEFTTDAAQSDDITMLYFNYMPD
ncbi:hypothetical protein [Candidatus Magnetomonas plexicatena]